MKCTRTHQQTKTGPFGIRAAPAKFSGFLSSPEGETETSGAAEEDEEGRLTVVEEEKDPSVDSDLFPCQLAGDCVPSVVVEIQAVRPNEKVSPLFFPYVQSFL